MMFFALSSPLAPASKRLGKDGDSGDWCLQVKAVSDSVAGGGKEIGDPGWGSVSNYSLDSVREIMDNYSKLVCSVIIRSRII